MLFVVDVAGRPLRAASLSCWCHVVNFSINLQTYLRDMTFDPPRK